MTNTNKTEKYSKSDIIKFLKWCIKMDFLEETLKYYQYGYKSKKLKVLERIFNVK